MTTITNLKCEYQMNPLGIDIEQPRFSWQMQTERQSARQIAYRILVATTAEQLTEHKADFWDSGKVESDQSVHLVYGGKPLASRQHVYWKVLVWDETSAVNESDIAWFEMGLLKPEDWQADWIGSELVGGQRTTIPSPYVRKPFSVSADIQSARLYVTALGFYECSINGQIVSDDVFNPGWTDYNKRIQYNVYDVTDVVQSGDNVIGAILGDGWASGHVGMGNRQTYVDRPRLLAQLEITTVDGKISTINTDNSWKYAFGALLENDIMMGESYDARLEMPGWDSPNFDDSDWRCVEVFEDIGANLVATNGPTVKRIEELKPIRDPIDRGNFILPRHVFDMGQNMVGRVRIKGSAPAGTTVMIRFAEVLNDDGTLYVENLRGARPIDNYTFKGGGEEIWEPRFTFHGFRYVEVAGFLENITRDTVTGIVLHSEMEQTGEFECSEPILNQLQHNILWGQKGNFVDVPTDCPQRDERLGWTGDIQVFARTATFNMDIAGFMSKWAIDVADAQTDVGSIPAVVPTAINFPDGGPAWSDAAVICPWTMYLSYGDKRILEENYDVMTRFMDFIIQRSPGFIRCAPGYDGWMGFGDWLSINANTPRDLIGTAFLAYDADLMAQIAEVLGKADDQKRYRQLFEDTKAAFQKRYLKGGLTPEEVKEISVVLHGVEADADAISQGNLEVVDYGTFESEVFNSDLFAPTQTSYVLALHFNLLPDNLCEKATSELVTDIERRDMHLSTGFVGSPYLPHVLSNNNRADVAYSLLHQKTWPSWLYSVTQGATTIWERWDGWTEDRGFQDPMMNSFNHYAYGAIGNWLYNTIAGINIDPAQPGYKHIIFSPVPGGGLDHARATIKTAYGEIVSDWKLEGNTFTYSIVIPPNTTASVILPMDGDIQLNGESVQGQLHKLDAGQYEFNIHIQ